MAGIVRSKDMNDEQYEAGDKEGIQHCVMEDVSEQNIK
jgi:hypothetical protein